MAFIFNANAGETPESVARKREIADVLAARALGRAPRDVGEGLTAVGQALAFRRMMNQVNKGEAAGRESAAGAFAPIISALSGGGVGGGSTGVPDASVPMDPASARVAQAFAAQGDGSDIRQGLVARGLPEHVADAFVMNFKDESGLNPGINEQNPIVPGSRGGFGLAQWTGPRRKALEAFAAQRGAEVGDANMQLDFLMDELKGPESAAFQKIMGAQDTGSAAAAIVNNFLRPAEAHRAKREAAYLGSAGRPAQVASLDPSAGMPTPQMTPDQVASSYMQTQGIDPVQTAQMGANNPGNIAKPGPGGTMVQETGDFPPAPQMAPAGPTVQQLLQAAQNPWLNDSQRGIVNMLLERQMTPKKYDFITGRDGAIFRADPEGGGLEQLYGGKPDKFNVLSQEEEAQLGLDPAGSYQRGADNKISKIGGEGTTVNIDQKTEGAFDKKLAEKQAEAFDAMATEGLNAKADLAVIGELETLLGGQGGTLTGLSGALAKYGIGGEGVDDLQAAQALINKLVPTQRLPGSGSMSDRDVELFTRSLPSLWNSPGGNAKILRVMRGLAEYKQAQGDISAQVTSGALDRQEARKMLQALPNPLAGLDKQEEAPKGGPAAGAVEDGYRFKGGDPSDPNNWEPVQ